MRLLLALLALVCAQAFVTRPAPARSSIVQMAKEKTESIGKAELVDTLKEKTGLAKKDIDEVISAFASAVREEVLVGGKEIRLRDFGTFKRKVTAARVGRNPRTGEELQISGAKSVSFSVSSSLKVKDAPAPAKKAKK